ncbi:MAG: 50S ribosomal protein L11 methyltransferase, partial [Bacteroidota bacterium]
PAIENCLENLASNRISQVKTYLGTLEIMPQKTYDILLANINRNVILDSLPTLYQQLKKNGTLLVSGFIKKDANLLHESAKKHGFETLDQWHRNNWICMSFTK